MSMKCEKCGQSASYQIEWETNGKFEEHFYCSECYHEINPKETFAKNSKFYSEIRKTDEFDQEREEECGCEVCGDELDESGVPFEYSSESDGNADNNENNGIPQFLLEQLGKIESILAVEILSPKRIERIAKNSLKKTKKEYPSIYCPNCGISQEEIMITQKAGCVKCYQLFDNVLLQKHRRFSDGKQYCGKKYEPKIIWSDVDYLQKELNFAVKNQNFEHAAKLRDEMTKLQKKA